MTKLSVSIPDDLWSLTTAIYSMDSPSRLVQDALRAYLQGHLGFYPTDEKIKGVIARGIKQIILEHEPEGEQGELWESPKVAEG